MKLYAESILIGNQWLADQTLSIDDNGIIETIEPGKSLTAQLVRGVVLPGIVTRMHFSEPLLDFLNIGLTNKIVFGVGAILCINLSLK